MLDFFRRDLKRVENKLKSLIFWLKFFFNIARERKIYKNLQNFFFFYSRVLKLILEVLKPPFSPNKTKKEIKREQKIVKIFENFDF